MQEPDKMLGLTPGQARFVVRLWACRDVLGSLVWLGKEVMDKPTTQPLFVVLVLVVIVSLWLGTCLFQHWARYAANIWSCAKILFDDDGQPEALLAECFRLYLLNVEPQVVALFH